MGPVTDGLMVITGFILLAKGAGWMLNGACAAARRAGMSELVMGLTIVAMATSLPEMCVSLSSAISGKGDIALGNIAGSNIANLCLVLGVAGLLRPIPVSTASCRRDLPFAILAAAVLLVVTLFFNEPHMVSRLEAGALLLLLATYMTLALRDRSVDESEPVNTPPMTVPRMIFFSLLGLGCLAGGGELVVRGASSLARTMGVSEAAIGAFIVAIGTSLPEMAASITAVLRKRPAIAIGNVLGSNILNTFLVLGTVGMVHPIHAVHPFWKDATVGVGASLLLLLFMRTGGRKQLDRWEALLFLGLYAGYITLGLS